MAPRFTLLEAVTAILLVAGGLTALVASRLGMEGLKNLGIVVVILSVFAFGLDMIVQRRAEIGTRYSSSINPSFHVFRGVGAIAWGIVFVVAAMLAGGFALIWLTNWADARNFFSEHNGIVIVLAGILLTALGVGSASKATYRYQQSERPERRLADRVAAIAFIVPLGLVILSWGLTKTFAPSLADSVRDVTGQWLESLVKRIVN